MNFETILIKNLINNNELFSKTMNLLDSSYFTDIGNQETFKLIKKYYTEYKEIPKSSELITMVKNVSNSEIRNQITNSLIQAKDVEIIENTKFLLDETLKFCKDALYYKALEIGSDGLMKKDDNLKLKAKEIFEQMSKISVDTDLGLDFDDFEAMIEYYSDRKRGILTQHKEFNKRIYPGFLPGTLNIILAAQGIGKSLLMTDLLSGIFMNSKNILFVSLEMLDKEVMKRVHANALDLPINRLSDLSRTEGELKKLKDEMITPLTKEDVIAAYNKAKMTGKCGKLFIKDAPAGAFSALNLENLVETFKIEQGIIFDIIFVDYVGIAKSDILSPSVGLYSYIKSVGEEFRGSAKKLNVPIVSASQLNRSVHGKDVKDVDNSSISDSMGTAMTADFMLFLLQDEQMKAEKRIVLKCTKNRYTGRTDTWIMDIDYEHMRFKDVVMENSVELKNLIDEKQTNDALDFGVSVVSGDYLKKADEFANSEIKEIIKEDLDKLLTKPKELVDETEQLFKELGIS